MAEEGLEQRLEGELPADLQGAFDEQGHTVIPGYQAPAVDPEDAGGDLDAQEAEVKADAATDDDLLGADDTAGGDDTAGAAAGTAGPDAGDGS